jgi:hypothetical protein
MEMKVWPGLPYPLGATWDGGGVNVALFAENASGVELCLFDAEGNHLGPTLCFRGIANAAYYRLVSDDRRYYMDYIGCGNTLDMTHPRVLQLIMDSLRYWALEMHVDGFRFDLAAALARELGERTGLSVDGQRCFGLWLAGDAIAEVDSRGNRIVDVTLLILLNAYHEPLRLILPFHPSEMRWQVLLDIREALDRWRYRPIQAGQAYELGARTLALLRLGTDD